MNLIKIQKKIDEFILSNSQDVMTSSEYLVYTANLLFALAVPMLAVDGKHNMVDTRDYYSVEEAYMKDSNNSFLGILMVAHSIINISKSFSND